MPKNKNQRKRRNIGNKARQRLPFLLEKYDYKCYWCNQPITMLRSIPEEWILYLDHGIITYKKNGNFRNVLIASVDHKIGLVDGGTNSIDNLVPSCRYCNEQRGRLREAIHAKNSSSWRRFRDSSND